MLIIWVSTVNCFWQDIQMWPEYWPLDAFRIQAMAWILNVYIIPTYFLSPVLTYPNFCECDQAVDKLNELSVKVSPGEEENEELRRELLMKCAATAMSSKLIHQVTAYCMSSRQWNASGQIVFSSFWAGSAVEKLECWCLNACRLYCILLSDCAEGSFINFDWKSSN